MIEVGRKQPTLRVLLSLAGGLNYSLAKFMGMVQERYALERTAASHLTDCLGSPSADMAAGGITC